MNQSYNLLNETNKIESGPLVLKKKDTKDSEVSYQISSVMQLTNEQNFFLKGNNLIKTYEIESINRGGIAYASYINEVKPKDKIDLSNTESKAIIDIYESTCDFLNNFIQVMNLKTKFDRKEPLTFGKFIYHLAQNYEYCHKECMTLRSLLRKKP